MRMNVLVIAVAAALAIAPCASGTIFLHEDFENGVVADWARVGQISGAWGPSLWHHEDFRQVSGVYSIAYNTGSPTYNFNIGHNWGMYMSPWVDLSSATDLQLEFYSWLDAEGDPTFGGRERSGQASVMYTVLGDPVWYPLPVDPHSMPEEQWNFFHTDLAGLAGEPLPTRIGFLFDSLDAVDNLYEGWYVDDVTLFDSATPPIPEPSTWLLLSTGLLGVGAACRRRFRP